MMCLNHTHEMQVRGVGVVQRIDAVNQKCYLARKNFDVKAKHDLRSTNFRDIGVLFSGVRFMSDFRVPVT
jgi:hypothetical protein